MSVGGVRRVLEPFKTVPRVLLCLLVTTITTEFGAHILLIRLPPPGENPLGRSTVALEYLSFLLILRLKGIKMEGASNHFSLWRATRFFVHLYLLMVSTT